MNALARDTGGEPFFNTNDLGRALGRALDENRVYYRIAYHSPEGEGAKKFRRIALRVKNHPEYRVRAQRGYRPEAVASEAARTPQQKFVEALLSPLPSTAVPVEASADFYAGAADDAQVSFRAHIDASGLDFRAQGDGKLTAFEIDVVTGVYDLSGKLVASFPERVKSSLTAERLALVRRDGLDSVKRLGLKPGLYQIRFGVREPATERVGTASVVVEVPDLSRGRLALSSVFLRRDAGGSVAPAAEYRHGLRVYRGGESPAYQFRVYNAGAPDAAHLSMRLELRQGGSTIYAGPWQPLAPLVVARDAKGIEAGGQLKAALPAGAYELAVGVRDERRKQAAAGSVAFFVER
jgi:hypothetical protein